MRVLIVGGYGFFGARLARLLADIPGVRTIIGGRDLAKARAVADGLANAEPAGVDRDGDLDAAFAALTPQVVVDASGPFQAYGADPYRVVRAALAAGAHYLDLADAAPFIAGVAAFDAEAKGRGRVVLSGLSTIPALSGAALRAMGLERIDSAAVGIAPSPFAGLGLNVVRAIALQAGRPVLSAAGERPIGVAMVDTRRRIVAPPGAAPLAERTFSLIQSLRGERPDIEDIWTGAGTAPQLWQRGLNGLARLVRWRILPSLAPFAGLFHAVANTLRWGEHRGGMFVEATGEAAGAPASRSWHLIAEGDDGPFIPAFAAAAVISALAAGRPPAPGARSAAGELDMADFEPFFAARRIVHGMRGQPGAGAFRIALGEAFARLPAVVQALHVADGDQVFEGRASIERGRGPIAALVCAVVGFPKAAADTAVRVEITRVGGRETWRRIFAGKAFESRLAAGRGRWTWLVAERFGLVALGLAMVVEGDRLRYVIRSWSFLGVPMPRFLGPRTDTFETEEDGRFVFDVEIALPLVGRVVHYRGWLESAA